jgi:hypothetical protein
MQKQTKKLGFCIWNGQPITSEVGCLFSLNMDRSKNRTQGTPLWKLGITLGRLWNQTSPLEQLLQAKSLEQKGLAGLSWDRLRQKMVAWGGIEPPTQGFSILCSTD